MKSRFLRKTTLLSLLGVSAAQSSSTWGEPFTVDYSSTDTLVATSASSTWGEPFTVDNSLTSDIPTETGTVAASTTVIPAESTMHSETASGYATGTSFTVMLPNTTQTVVTFTSSVASGNFTRSTTGTASGSNTASGSETAGAPQNTGGAAIAKPYVRMGVAGVIAGAAGVFFL